MNQDEYREVLIEIANHYIVPFYQIIAGIFAFAIIALAIYLVISNFIRRV